MAKTRIGYVLAFLATVGLLGLASPMMDASARQSELVICHQGSPISIPANSWPTHEAHGDAVANPDGTCGSSGSDIDQDGVADDADNCPTVANSDQSNRYGDPATGDACEDSDGDGTFDVDAYDICVSVNGENIVTSGTARCESEQPAELGGPTNEAVAIGTFASAYVNDGSGNRAVAIGESAISWTGHGDGNSAHGEGDGAYAVAGIGSDNTATATGNAAWADARRGNSNTAVADGANSQAVATDGDDCTAVANTNETASCP